MIFGPTNEQKKIFEKADNWLKNNKKVRVFKSTGEQIDLSAAGFIKFIMTR